MSHRLFITDDSGHILDVCQLDRYNLDDRIDRGYLIDDIQEARKRQPADWQLRPAIANEVAGALKSALAALDAHAGRPPEADALREVKSALRKLESLSAYAMLPPDEQRQQLVTEMSITAQLTEQLEELFHLVRNAACKARDLGLSYDEFDDLARYLDSCEDPIPVSVPNSLVER
jgi:transcription elongation GreA/GreB family factor